MAKEWERPEVFKCGVTGVPMRDAIRCADGFAYDRDRLGRGLEKRGRSPRTPEMQLTRWEAEAACTDARPKGQIDMWQNGLSPNLLSGGRSKLGSVQSGGGDWANRSRSRQD